MRSIVLFLLIGPMLAPAAVRAAAQASSLQHVIVYYEKDRFGGWPANNGIWSWGDEIAVGFTRAWFKHDPEEHSRDSDKPVERAIAR
ncbi:MAG: hypothetical protein ACREIA_23950, partial [Opitutaceae bacterium]